MNIKVTIKEINEQHATLKLEDDKVILWPISHLPKEIKIDDILTFSINDNGKIQEPEQLAKDLLNEILNIE